MRLAACPAGTAPLASAVPSCASHWRFCGVARSWDLTKTKGRGLKLFSVYMFSEGELRD